MKGFSLLEILIALMLIGLLATFSVPTFIQPLYQVQQNKAKTELYALANALQNYYELHFTYQGATLEGLGFHTDITDYQLKIVTLAEQNFKIAAIMNNKKVSCTEFYLDQDGNKSSWPKEPSHCW